MVEKYHVELPSTVMGIVKCDNPKCITNNEPMRTRFDLVDPAHRVIRCYYCGHFLWPPPTPTSNNRPHEANLETGQHDLPRACGSRYLRQYPGALQHAYRGMDRHHMLGASDVLYIRTPLAPQLSYNKKRRWSLPSTLPRPTGPAPPTGPEFVPEPTYDKWAETGLTPVAGVSVGCPYIEESPLSIECRVRDVMELGSHDMFIADVAGVIADDRFIDPDTGAFDLARAGLMAYSHGGYYELGRCLGRFGWSVKGQKRDSPALQSSGFSEYSEKFHQTINSSINVNGKRQRHLRHH